MAFAAINELIRSKDGATCETVFTTFYNRGFLDKICHADVADVFFAASHMFPLKNF